MKKFISMSLAILILFSMIPVSTLAVEVEDQAMQELDTVQQEIDAIFTELNEMAAEERMAQLLAEESIEIESKMVFIKAQNDQRKENLENRLESLGINTIDPNNPDDMEALEEVMLGSGNTSVKSIPDPPNLENLVDCYTLRQYTSSLTVDGTSYKYSYIYVTDDLGYSDSPLTHSKTANKLIGKENTLLSDILDFQFSFGFSSYLGAIPYGWVADWFIGTVFTALESYNENSIISYSGNNNIYNMSMLSVTQMMYIYVYLPDVGEWLLCGTRAPNISYARAEYLIANVDGTAVSDLKDYSTVSSSTGSAASTYVRNYINDRNHKIDYIGSFTVNTYNGETIRFTPGFAQYPGYLI